MIDVTLSELIRRYRLASSATFESHFLPYASSERDFEVFSVVDDAMFQVMVLDWLAPPAGEPEPTIILHPHCEDVVGALQQPPATQRMFGMNDRFAFLQFISSGQPYGGLRELDLVLCEMLDGSDNEVVFKWSEVVVEEQPLL